MARLKPIPSLSQPSCAELTVSSNIFRCNLERTLLLEKIKLFFLCYWIFFYVSITVHKFYNLIDFVFFLFFFFLVSFPIDGLIFVRAPFVSVLARDRGVCVCVCVIDPVLLASR